MVLLDTSILVDLLRGRGDAAARLAALERRREPIKIPAVALFELHRGVAASRAPAAERERIHAVLASNIVVPFDEEAARLAGDVAGALLAQGRTIDPEDAMIAGTALAAGESLLTRNRRHYERIDGLRLED